ncbi:helix-turn-helix domain-containing protein [Patescibacteria group bacterium]|nr:helix-turn-helix domain-containing protein [Patescibacteria group bacterium]
MSDWGEKSIQGTTLGDFLRQQREAVGKSIPELARQAQVQEKYVQAFEQNAVAQLPDFLYQQFFLRSIARVLHLDAEELLVLHASQQEHVVGLRANALPPARASWRSFMVAPRVVSAAVVAGLAVFGLGVLGWEIRGMTALPALALSTPADGSLSAIPTVSVAGLTERGTELRINGELVYLSADGKFSEAVNLHRGVNIIKIAAKKVHSDEQVLYRRVLWNGSSALGDGGAAAVAAIPQEQRTQ